MRRHPGLDPPEYLEWHADPALAAEYEAALARSPERRRLIEGLDEAARLRFYAGMVRFRLHDYTLKRWVRRGVISKAWLGTGEEAVTIGAVHALEPGQDYVAPMIRNQGALHEMGMPLESLFAGYLGTAASPSGGRDGHVGDLARGVIAPISHVGDMVPVITGAALAFKQRREPGVALTWIGDGSTKTGAAHEGFNLAGVLKVPAIFIIQNNQVALGTRTDQHHAGDFAAWGDMYGMECTMVAGNNVLEVYGAVRHAADRARAGNGPFLLEFTTYRFRGHSMGDPERYRKQDEVKRWQENDPIGIFRKHLVDGKLATSKVLDEVDGKVMDEVEQAVQFAEASPEPTLEALYQDIYAD